MKRQNDMVQLVRELRQRLDLTQEKFAAKLGVTFPTINRWDNGRAKPSPFPDLSAGPARWASWSAILASENAR